MANKKAANLLPKLAETERDLLSHIQHGYQLETDSLGGNPVLRHTSKRSLGRHMSYVFRTNHIGKPHWKWRLRVLQRAALRWVDVVIRLILDDINVCKHGFPTFNPRDFGDLCRKHQMYRWLWALARLSG
ncbi:MAG TPA: hypothetical protein VN950_03270 [Terriglobales bacterium]|nr:hypothetical protein [Terriglobales bacterium]